MRDLNNCYILLGINKNSTIETIKKAYKIKAKKLHPDLNNGNSEDFIALNEAYDFIIKTFNNPIKEVDTFSVDFSNWSWDNTNTNTNNTYEHYSYAEEMGFNKKDSYYNNLNNDFNPDVIQPPFTTNARGEDIYITIDITYEEQCNYRNLINIYKKISYKRNIKCNSCKGLGHKSYSCTHCNGLGQKYEVNYSPKYGKTTTSTKCSVCGGKGYISVEDKCGYCKGLGYNEVLFESDIPIDLISIIENKQNSLCFEGLGHETINPKEWGLNGNLIVNINLLKKVNENITKVYIDFIKAIEGCNLNLNLDEGKFNINLNIPSGIKSGTKLKVTKGDNLYLIEVLITVPKLEELNKKSTKLITQLKELL